jgi:hypothetical protein
MVQLRKQEVPISIEPQEKQFISVPDMVGIYEGPCSTFYPENEEIVEGRTILNIWNQKGCHFWGNVLDQKNGTWLCVSHLTGVILDDFSIYLNYYSKDYNYATTSFGKLTINKIKTIEVVTLWESGQTCFGSYKYTNLTPESCTVE